MNLVLWLKDKPHHRALACKIATNWQVKAIFIEENTTKKKNSFSLFSKFIEKILTGNIDRTWTQLLRFYSRKYPEWPIKPIRVKSINDASVLTETTNYTPDLIIVSGTSLIKKELLIIKTTIGILNLHTGLSPYVKGGPNCTNWCIAQNELHLIGNTVMWIDQGIDSGNIVCSELTTFNGEETFFEIHLKVMEHAHALYLHAITNVLQNRMKGISQNEIGTGKTYYTKDWNLKNKLNLIRNLKHFQVNVLSSETLNKKKQVKTIGI